MKKIFYFSILFFLFIGSASASNKLDKVKYSKCVDGDTAKFILKNEEITVRFLAINTPEIKHGEKKAEYYGDEAKDYTCKRLEKANIIELEYDPNSDKTDKYGRYLAWIFVDNKLLQEDLVKKGYAETKYLYGDYKYTDTLKKYEAKAKEKRLGIWEEKDDFDLQEIILNLDFRIKILITSLCILIVFIVLACDKKARRKALRKGKKDIKKLIKDNVKR